MIIGNLTNKKFELSLSRFEFDFSAELSQIFKSLGMKDAFNYFYIYILFIYCFN